MLQQFIHINTDAISGNTAVIAIVGYFVVFTALVALYFVFYSLPKILKINWRSKKHKGQYTSQTQREIEISGEVNAAISLAMYLHFNEYHDDESNVMTIKRISRSYSPWSSKIYAVRNQFNRL